VLGARERSDSLVRDVVLADERAFTPLLVTRAAGQETQLFAKEVLVAGRRYIVCRNEAEAEKDRADRQAVVAALEQQLQRGDKSLIGNSAYRRYLRRIRVRQADGVAITPPAPAFEIDAGKLADEAKFDGIFVLRTNSRISPLLAMLRYRDLLRVEQLFRAAKSALRTGRSSTPPTRPFAATSSAPSSPWCCRRSWPIAARRSACNSSGMTCGATSTGCSTPPSSRRARSGNCAPRPPAPPPVSSRRCASPCRRASGRSASLRRHSPPLRQNVGGDPDVVPRVPEFRRLSF
jgi:hypothetical protein